MKKARCYFLIMVAGCMVFQADLLLAQSQKPPAGDVEIFIQGRKYKSIRAYKRERIKAALEGVLTSRDLRDFTEAELTSIVKEIRDKEVSVEAPDAELETDETLSGSEDARVLSPFQMREMLKIYLSDNEHVAPIDIDPDKVKSIIIKNRGPLTDILEN